MANEKNDQPFGGQTIGPANGKDVLYGWLVGRAAADLGLAQAIASSEAQRVEQIRRLEEALLGQMRELQNSQAAAGSASDSANVDLLQDQVQQFIERQNGLEAQQLTSSRIESELAAKIRGLEAFIEQPPTAIANPEVCALRAQVAELVERITDAEAAASREPIPVDTRLAQEQIALAVREQTEALENSWQKKLDGLQQEIREKAALLRLRDGELTDVRVQLAGVTKRLDYVAATPPSEVSASERKADRALWQRDFDERLTARLRELSDEIRDKLHGVTSAKVDQEQFRGETLALTARIAQLEQSNQNASADAASEARDAYQATVALREEIAALKSTLLEQQGALPNEALVRSVEAMLREQIHEVHKQIAQHQRGTIESENQFQELRGDIQTLIQRQVQAETVAQQTHALVTQDTAQLRGAVKADMAALEAQLNERRARDAALSGVEETVNVRLRELHNQVAQGMLALDRRDGEVRELKTQLQTLAQRVGDNGLPRPLASVSRPDGLTEGGAAAPLGEFAASLPPVELRTVVTSGSMDSGANLLQPALPVDSVLTDPVKVPAVDLHDRLSAEIERKRAELREKSGRWKVRQ
ncbi:MAG: hypothetical protein ACXW5W_00890 [Candidatus Binatia bacterium]